MKTLVSRKASTLIHLIPCELATDADAPAQVRHQGSRLVSTALALRVLPEPTTKCQNNQRDSGEPLLRVDQLPENVRADSGGRQRFRFLANGTALGNTGTIRLCMHGLDDRSYRVIIANTGRVRSEQDSVGCT